MITPFASPANGSISASAFTATTLYARSTNAADTGTLTNSGLDESSVAESEALTLTGQREKAGTDEFTKFFAAALSAAQAGTVAVYKAGTAGSGTIILSAQPTTADTVTIGLTGFTQAYTFRARAQSTIVCNATAGLTQGDYFDIALSGGSARRFWYDIDAAGTGAPADPGGGLSEIDIVTGDTADQVATKTEAVIEAVTNLNSSVSTSTITIDYAILGTMTVTDGPGDALGTITAVQAGTTDAAYQVAIGATASETAENLRDAINDSVGTEGTDYGTSTAVNPYLTATVSGVIVTVTDRIACLRYLGWSFAKSGPDISVSAPVGGANGDLLATLTAGQTALYNTISLDDEALTLGLLPGLVNWTSAAVRVSGKRFSIYVAASDVTAAMVASYEFSTQTIPTAWRSGITSIASLDNNSQIITPAEVVEHVRLKINNTNAGAASVNAKVCKD